MTRVRLTRKLDRGGAVRYITRVRRNLLGDRSKTAFWFSRVDVLQVWIARLREAGGIARSTLRVSRLSAARRWGADGKPKREFIRARALTVAGLVILAGLCACRQPQKIGRTVVLISMDTTRPDHMSVYGYPRPTTPSLLKLAKDGIVFDQAIAVHTNTCPSHASMLTGVYPPTHGSLCNGVRVSSSIPTMAEDLAGNGFVTAAFVSGVTLKAAHCGLDRGFSLYDDDFEGFARGARATLNRTAGWLWRRKPKEDIFLFFHLYDPHFEYNPPRKFSSFALKGQAPDPIKVDALRKRIAGGEHSSEIDRSLDEWIRRYDGEIAYADWAVGQLLHTLKELRRYQGALILMVSDHGETLAERPWVFDHGTRVSEEQIRIAMIMKLPDQASAGRRISEPVSHIDILPTVFAQLGLPENSSPVGIDLHRFLDNTPPEDRMLFTMARRVPKRMTDFDFKVPQPGQPGNPTSQIIAVRSGRYKLVDYGFMSPKNLLVLYDLKKDPHEKQEVLWDPETPVSPQTELHSAMEEWWEKSWRPETASDTAIPEETARTLRSLGYIE